MLGALKILYLRVLGVREDQNFQNDDAVLIPGIVIIRKQGESLIHRATLLPNLLNG